MRERTTWNRDQIAKQASMAKQADPATLNNPDHMKAQPSADKYVTGDPSSFGEDVASPKDSWEAEYSGGQVKRNEIGMPEMRGDTFNHAEKTASEELLVKKASLCIKVARLMLSKKASDGMIEEQSLSLMHLPDSELISTFSRLAEEQDQQEEETDKQAGQMPPQFKENAEKKKEEAEDKKDQGQSKEAQTSLVASAITALQKGDSAGAQVALASAITAAARQMLAQQQEEQKDQEQQKQAQDQQEQKDQEQQKQAQDQQQQDQGEQQKKAQQDQQQDQDKQAQMGQTSQQQIAQQIQALCQQQASNPMAQMQQQSQLQQLAQQLMSSMQGQQAQQQAPMAQQQMPVADDMLLDQMLMDQGAAPMADMDLELEAPAMDVGDGDLGPDDAHLMSLFANGDEAQQAQQAQQGQDKQASHVVRTASTRTVGARPTQGVSRIGGSPSVGGGSDLSKLWNSAPDVSGVFGVPKS